MGDRRRRTLVAAGAPRDSRPAAGDLRDPALLRGRRRRPGQPLGQLECPRGDPEPDGTPGVDVVAGCDPARGSRAVVRHPARLAAVPPLDAPGPRPRQDSLEHERPRSRPPRPLLLRTRRAGGDRCPGRDHGPAFAPLGPVAAAPAALRLGTIVPGPAGVEPALARLAAGLAAAVADIGGDGGLWRGDPRAARGAGSGRRRAAGGAAAVRPAGDGE